MIKDKDKYSLAKKSSLIEDFNLSVGSNENELQNNLLPDLDYKVLILVSDGDVCDLDATLNQILRANSLPVSLIIIGVGQEKMELNRTVFETKFLRKNSQGGFVRDFVRFLHLADYTDGKMNIDRETFLKKAVEDLPMQIVEFFRLRGIDPFWES